MNDDIVKTVTHKYRVKEFVRYAVFYSTTVVGPNGGYGDGNCRPVCVCETREQAEAIAKHFAESV